MRLVFFFHLFILNFKRKKDVINLFLSGLCLHKPHFMAVFRCAEFFTSL